MAGRGVAWNSYAPTMHAVPTIHTESMSFGKTQGVRGFRHLKLSEIVDVFLPSLAVSSPVCELVKRTGIDVPTLQLDTDQTFRLRRPAFLQTVVSEYEFLDPEERNEARLRIGWGPRLPDSKAFRRIQQYFATRGARIYHGGVAVWLHGPNFSLRFFDPVARSKQGGKEHFEVSQSVPMSKAG